MKVEVVDDVHVRIVDIVDENFLWNFSI